MYQVSFGDANYGVWANCECGESESKNYRCAAETTAFTASIYKFKRNWSRKRRFPVVAYVSRYVVNT